MPIYCRTMDRQWMYGDRCTMVRINSLKSFLDAAEDHKSSKGFMCCPCRTCQNKKEYSNRHTLHAHIYQKGFMDNYMLWTKHGEPGVLMQEGEGDDDDDNNIAYWAHLYEAGAFEDEPMDETEANSTEDQPPDELGHVLVDGQRDSETLKESKKFEMMLEDHKKVLYPNCKKWLKKLGTTLEMLQWKAANGITDKGFEELLGIVKNILPEGNKLPSTTYEAKKVVCPLGLDI